MTILTGWENFYVIVGSSAATLIGLQFIFLSLLVLTPIGRAEAQAGGAFVTPGIVHFGAVLLLSAIVSAPWDGISTVAVLWGLVGFCGAVYVVIVARRMRVQKAYSPVFEDWLFHVLLPFVAYAVLAISAYEALFDASLAMFLVAAVVLSLLFIGIHNTWDAVTYTVFVRLRQNRESHASDEQS
jgi:hypothetical protein